MDTEVAVAVGGLVVAAVTVLLVILQSRRWPYPAEDCRHSCPNMGACEGCDLEYP